MNRIAKCAALALSAALWAGCGTTPSTGSSGTTTSASGSTSSGASSGSTTGATTTGATTTGSGGTTSSGSSGASTASSGTSGTTSTSGTAGSTGTTSSSTGSTGAASTSGSTGTTSSSSSTSSTSATSTSGSTGTTSGTTSAGSTTGGSGSTSGTTGGTASYTVTDLGPAQVESINNAGQIAGQTCASGTCLAAVWQASTGWVTTPLPSGGAASVAIGVDTSGKLALNVSFPYQRGSYWRGYTSPPLQPIPTTAPVPGDTLANAIDFETGHVVGYDQGLGGGYLFDGVTLTPIAVQPGSDYLSEGYGQAVGLNREDQVVGWVRTSESQYNTAPKHAFLWDHGTLRDLGTLEQGLESAAVAINDRGAVTGWSTLDPQNQSGTRLFYWDGTMHELGCPTGGSVCTPSAMNAQGDIVGTALDPVSHAFFGFVYSQGAFHRLDQLVAAPGWSFEYAQSINDAGQIVGTGLLNGSPHAFLLTP